MVRLAITKTSVQLTRAFLLRAPTRHKFVQIFWRLHPVPIALRLPLLWPKALPQNCQSRTETAVGRSVVATAAHLLR